MSYWLVRIETLLLPLKKLQKNLFAWCNSLFRYLNCHTRLTHFCALNWRKLKQNWIFKCIHPKQKENRLKVEIHKFFIPCITCRAKVGSFMSKKTLFLFNGHKNCCHEKDIEEDITSKSIALGYGRRMYMYSQSESYNADLNNTERFYRDTGSSPLYFFWNYCFV